MFNDFDSFDTPAGGRSLRRRKTLKQRGTYLLTNMLILPVVGVVYATIIADGVRILMPVFARRLYQLPIPGAGMARRFDGWNRADLAIIVALLLFVVITWVWCKIFTELQGVGTIVAQREKSPITFYLLSFIAAVLILFDGAIFYFGLSSQVSGGWSNDGPDYVVPAATLLYSCGLAVLGWYHSDYQTSKLV